MDINKQLLEFNNPSCDSIVCCVIQICAYIYNLNVKKSIDILSNHEECGNEASQDRYDRNERYAHEPCNNSVHQNVVYEVTRDTEHVRRDNKYAEKKIDVNHGTCIAHNDVNQVRKTVSIVHKSEMKTVCMCTTEGLPK